MKAFCHSQAPPKKTLRLRAAVAEEITSVDVSSLSSLSGLLKLDRKLQTRADLNE